MVPLKTRLLSFFLFNKVKVCFFTHTYISIVTDIKTQAKSMLLFLFLSGDNWYILVKSTVLWCEVPWKKVVSVLKILQTDCLIKTLWLKKDGTLQIGGKNYIIFAPSLFWIRLSLSSNLDWVGTQELMILWLYCPKWWDYGHKPHLALAPLVAISYQLRI